MNTLEQAAEREVREILSNDQGPTILVVDDMATNRKLVAQTFRDQACRILEAADGDAALEVVAGEDVDMVLLDIEMPKKDGMEVLTILRKVYTETDLPILMLTSSYEDDTIIEALELGASDFLTKPFEPKVLAARVGTHLARQRSERKMRSAKVEAEKANAAKSEFLANMSHELRTPLNAIIGFGEMLEEEAQELNLDDFAPDLKKITNAGKHLLSLINDILDLSKIEAGRMLLAPETFEVSEIVHEAATTGQALAANNGNTLKIKCADDLGVMYADMVKVRQVLFNLLSNAAKFTENGTITLTAERIDADGLPEIRFAVADTGIGISDQQMDKLFQEFTQADATTTRKYGGTGLGLALCRKFCELMGGTVDAESAPGKGSTFTVRMPVNEEKDTAAARDPAVQAGVRAGKTPMVLVVDDDQDIRQLFTRMLSRHDYEVAMATSGAQAMTMAKALAPDIIVLDVELPDRDGWDILSDLKSNADTADIPVVMCTVLDDKSRAYALGASEFLVKPINRENLIHTLDKYRCNGAEGTIMVVEDHAPTRTMIARTLSKAGWSVVEAEDGGVALEKLKGVTPNIILLDLLMPNVDGFEFIRLLRRENPKFDVPVVVVTAKDLTDADRQQLSNGVLDVVSKNDLTEKKLAEEITALVTRSVKNGAQASAAWE